MTKIKVIKRVDAGVVKAPASKKKKNKKATKQRSLEGTVKDWITERRENDDAEDRDRRSQLDSWNPDLTPNESPV
jgi:hypothetical protein